MVVSKREKGGDMEAPGWNKRERSEVYKLHTWNFKWSSHYQPSQQKVSTGSLGPYYKYLIGTWPTWGVQVKNRANFRYLSNVFVLETRNVVFLSIKDMQGTSKEMQRSKSNYKDPRRSTICATSSIHSSLHQNTRIQYNSI